MLDQDSRDRLQAMYDKLRNAKFEGDYVSMVNNETTLHVVIKSKNPPIQRPFPKKTNVLVKLTSVYSGGCGSYNGNIMVGSATDSGAGDFTMPESMTVGPACFIRNLDEDTSTTSDAAGTQRLLTPSYARGTLVGVVTSATTPVVFINGGVGQSTTGLITLPHGSYGSPNLATWSRKTDGKPVKFDPFWIGYDATSGTTFMMTRTAIYDARGILFSVSAEVQTTITC